jgi:hypothetical protein
MPIDPATSEVGVNQVLTCRNLSKVREWSIAPEQNACYKALSDYKALNHTLERFQYCPEDSKYYPIMKKYFEKWGHKNAFATGAVGRVGAHGHEDDDL